ncbi:MAG: hypothetical protein OXP12_03235 [Thaumarchaeota archaeon]|nr:hypothetical protein [Nitrososphaerota archaeon]MDE0266722.1 hypothetical protein [Nitrososphaerota archaeon]MDE0526542.1 hypothetical protein [Nitrososphaerota archaeon]
MSAKNLKILPLLAGMAIAAAAISAATYAQTAPEEAGPASEPSGAGAEHTVGEEDPDARVDAIGLAIIQLQLQNNELAKYPTNGAIQGQIEDNNETVEGLFAEWDVLMPPVPVAEISPADRHRMNSAMTRLMASDLPLLGSRINSSTGMLDVEIDANNATPDIEDRVRAIATDAQLRFTYSKDYPAFQGSDSQPTGH